MTTSVAAAVRSKILDSEDQFWRAEDFDGDSHAVVTELKRLADKGDLQRIRRDLYWRGHRTRFGMTSPTAVQVLEAIVGEGVAIGATSWHATNLLGLSTQVVPEPMFAVTARTPAGLSGMRIVNRSARLGRNEAELNSAEVTFLEALEGWDSFVELRGVKALERFTELLVDDSLRTEHLVAACGTESTAVRERFRAVLSCAGEHVAAENVHGARSAAGRKRALAVLEDL